MLAALLCLGGIAVSFSRGAVLGAGAALLVLALPWLLGRFGARWLPLVAVVGLGLVAVAALVLTLRDGVVGGSTSARLLLWREAAELVLRHPLGLGLDQFYYYHNPEFGRSILDPALAGTSEQFARHPHNLLLELWLLFTPLGLVAVAWLLARFARRTLPALRRAAGSRASLLGLGALAAMAAALTHGLVDTFYFWPDLAFAFWLLLGLGAAE